MTHDVTAPPQTTALRKVSRQVVEFETSIRPKRDDGPSPLKSILVGSTLVDRPAPVPAFLFNAGLPEGTLRTCSGRLAFIVGHSGRPASPAVH
jgi:hypothetical protein